VSLNGKHLLFILLQSQLQTVLIKFFCIDFLKKIIKP